MSHFQKSTGFLGTPDQHAQTGPEDRATPTAARAPEPAESASVFPLLAAGTLFGEVAALMHAATEVLNESIQTQQPAGLLVAARTLVEKAGAICDRAGHACGQTALQEQDDWLLSPRSAADMATLEHQRMQKLAADCARGPA
jgi:hypothetical protein